MISTLPKGKDWSHLTWDELYQLRRDEEGDADGFAGRALFLLDFAFEPMIEFLQKLEKQKKKKMPTLKYHNTATRIEIIRQSFRAAERAMEIARKIFLNKELGPKIGKIIGAG